MQQSLRMGSALLVTLLLSTVTWAQVQAPSAVRQAHEDYTDKVRQFIDFKESDQSSDEDVEVNSARTVINSATSLSDQKTEAVQEWPADKNLTEYFEQIRDERFIEENPEFPRRSTWLYPDDGCFARAAISSSRTEAMGLPVPTRVFVFGNLQVETKNTPWGSVTWWYHVTVAYRIDEQVYVIDPSVLAERPLKLEEWLDAMGDRSQMRVAFCTAGAYSPNSKCHGEVPLTYETALSSQSPYLRYEWRRLLDMNRNPNEELGDKPPWKLQ